MRIVARFIIGFAVILVLTGAVLYAMRKPLVEAAVERVMARAGLLNPQATLQAFSLSRLSLARVTAGSDPSAPDLAVDGVFIDYNWRTFFFRGKAKSVSIDDGVVAILIAENGAIDIAGWSPDPDAKPAPPPFDTLTIGKLVTGASTARGAARFDVSGAFDMSEGGEFDIGFKLDEAGNSAAAAGDGVVRLGADGSIDASGAMTGDASTPGGMVRDIDVEFDATLSSWRGFFGEGPRGLAGEATITLKASTIDAAAPIGGVKVAGALKAVFAGDGYAISVAGGPLKLQSGRGEYALISGGDDPLFESRDGAMRLSFDAQFGGEIARGAARLTATSENKGPWAVAASASLGDQSIGAVAIEAFDGAFQGVYAENRLTGDATIATHINAAEIGRLKITDMPAAARLAVTIDAKATTLTATPTGAECLQIERARLRMAEQDMRLRNAELCPAAAPLIAVNLNEQGKTHVEGALVARAARYEIGRTVFDGAPPAIDFALDYEPRIGTSRIAGEIADGRLILNNAFILSGAAGTFNAEIIGGAMSATAALSSMRIAQKAELEMVAPVAVAGEATLAKDVARFDFRVTTPNGAPLGVGEGSHQVKSGRGEALFDSGLLKFVYGFQPDRLLPALRGVISNASGTTEGRARYIWAPGEIASSATVNLDNLSFGGPGVAVTRTEGVTGKIAFSSLGPIATDGEQSLSIRKIDLDALKLENGRMRFALPGDQTLKIIEAEFPWFGGTIGAYQSEMSIVGGKAETTLQIDTVNLGDLLSYINVDGLSGEGVIEGVLPLTIEGGRARINKGILSSKGPGVIRYEGKATAAASQGNEQSALAFQILRELRFDRLAATIDGPLDGTLDFNILFEGRSDIPVRTGKKTQAIDSPVKYRITINAPLLSLIEQAILSTDVKLQIERAKKEEAAQEDGQ